MNINPVINCTFIIRSQAEYSGATQQVVLRCLLEKSATGQRRGFTDVEALLTALRAELLELQTQIIPSVRDNPENVAASGFMPTTPDAAPLSNIAPPTETDSPYDPKETTS